MGGRVRVEQRLGNNIWNLFLRSSHTSCVTFEFVTFSRPLRDRKISVICKVHFGSLMKIPVNCNAVLLMYSVLSFVFLQGILTP